MSEKKICPKNGGEMFAGCAMCINSPDKLAAECAKLSSDAFKEDYDRMNTIKGRKKRK